MDDIIRIEDDIEMQETPSLPVNQYRARKIVFCVDISDEMKRSLRATGNGGIKDTGLYTSSRLETIQRFLKRYVAMNKLIGNKADEYGMILLANIALWYADFTSEMSLFHNFVDNISSRPLMHYRDFDAQSLADTLKEYLNVQNTDFYYHTIVIYSRPTVVPRIMRNNVFEDMRKKRNFMLDVLFLHNGMTTSDPIQNVYDFWSNLEDESRPGWYYESNLLSGKDNIAIALAQLIGHPACRGKQEQIRHLL